MDRTYGEITELYLKVVVVEIVGAKDDQNLNGAY